MSVNVCIYIYTPIQTHTHAHIHVRVRNTAVTLKECKVSITEASKATVNVVLTIVASRASVFRTEAFRSIVLEPQNGHTD